MSRTVIVNFSPVSERYWAKGDKAIISNDQIRLSGCWFRFDDRYDVTDYTEDPKTWESCPREDLCMIPRMIAAGWKPEFEGRDARNERTTPDNPPHNGVSFSKDTHHTWKTRNGWMLTELIDGYYCNHRETDTLHTLLEAPDLNDLNDKRFNIKDECSRGL